MSQTRVSVSGDAESGWIVDVHDGDKQGTYTPTGKTVAAVIAAAMKEHAADEEPEHVEKPDDKPAPKAEAKVESSGRPAQNVQASHQTSTKR